MEEILQSVPSSKTQQKAITVLCQGVLNTISAKYENIGLIIFLRSDMAQNAITVNYEQFKQTFSYAELKWSSNEALKSEDGIMTAMEEKLMIQAGYLIRDGEKMYLPEIIRHALGFRYEKGARPRVLSLLLKH